MHDVVESTSELPNSTANAKNRRRSECIVAFVDEYDEPPTDYNRGRSKTFTHSRKVPCCGEDKVGYWTERCSVAKFNLSQRHLGDNRLLGLKSYHVTRWSLSGAVVVRNITYEKRVCIRYTLDDWKTFEDVEAQFLNADIVKSEDVFQFRLDFPFRLPAGTRLQLAVAYETAPHRIVHWDNNDGANYVFEYRFLQYC
jgi:hypothetical protein